MNVTWILDRYLLEKSCPEDGDTLPQAVQNAGYSTIITDIEQVKNDLSIFDDIPKDSVVITYGSFKFVRLSGRHPNIRNPGSYCRINELRYSHYSSHLNNLMLNNDYLMLPFGTFKSRRPVAGNFFIRPDSVTKLFAGQVIDANDFELEMNWLSQNRGVLNEDMVVFATPKNIEEECRFVIADGKVIAQSTYSWDEGFIPSRSCAPACIALAQDVARHPFQPDTVYTCDIALVDNGKSAKVIELNTFSCAGLYACDTTAIVRSVTASALNEYLGHD